MSFTFQTTLNFLSSVQAREEVGPSDNLVVDDTVVSTSGHDVLTGSAIADSIEGGDGNDTVYGGAGDDRLLGNQGDDALQGEAGHDSLAGGKGSDTLAGNEDHDTLQGNLGDDLLIGGAGQDSLHGGQGGDTLVSGQGDDTLNGGLDHDRFVFGAGASGNTHIAGFEGAGAVEGDFVQLSAGLLGGAAIESLLKVEGDSTVLTLSGGALTITFDHVTGLTADDFFIL